MLALETVGEQCAPAFAVLRFERGATALNVLAVVVVTRPVAVVRLGTVHPGTRGEPVVDESAVRVTECGGAETEHAVDDRDIHESLIAPVLLPPLDLSAVEVDSGTEGV